MKVHKLKPKQPTNHRPSYEMPIRTAVQNPKPRPWLVKPLKDKPMDKMQGQTCKDGHIDCDSLDHKLKLYL